MSATVLTTDDLAVIQTQITALSARITALEAASIKPPPPLTESGNGTTIPPVSNIVDSVSSVWTLAGGKVVRNGVIDAKTSSVVVLLYFNKIIYQKNTANLWWGWIGGTWVFQTGDPRAPLPSPTSAAPPQAAAAGYNKLDFSDDFDAWDGAKWTALIGYAPQSGQPPQVSYANSVVTLDASNASNVMLSSYARGKGGRTWTYGYFEARIFCTNWSSFWTWCKSTEDGVQVDINNPLTWAGEIDFIETNGTAEPGKFITTSHSNTNSGGGVPDQQSQTVEIVSPPLVGNWNVVGCLLTPTAIVTYCNDKLVGSMKPWPSAAQPRYMVLGAAPGGIGGSPVSQPVITKVDWVRVWTA